LAAILLAIHRRLPHSSTLQIGLVLNLKPLLFIYFNTIIFSMERIVPNSAGNGGAMPMLNYAMIEMAGKNIGNSRMDDNNNAGVGSNSTLITSSTNTMATNATGS
jgi:hypothetical protein